MSVDREEVERIARLAQLDLDDTEIERLTKDMNRILEHAERLREVREPEPGSAREEDVRHSARRGARSEEIGGVRDDSLVEPDSLDFDPSSFAPDWREGFFAVPPPPGVTADPES